MPTIKLPEITIPTIDIPDAPYFIEHKLEGKIPGCNLYHRDLETTRNPSLLIADPNGTYTVCPEGQIPSYNPMRYDPNEIIYTEETPASASPRTEETQNKTIKPKEDKKLEIEPCPGKKDLRVGSFVNEKRLERVKGYKRGEDGIPNPPQLVSTALIASVAATTPLLLNLVKPLVKNIIKKLTNKKKEKVK
jgi:hypothetical protein